MTEYICFFVLVVFALFGFSEAMHIAWLKLIFPKRKTNSQLIIHLENETAEKQLIFAGEQYLWLGSKFADSIVAENSKLEFDTYMRCKEIAQKYNIIFP